VPQTQKYFLEPQEASKSINYALERAENKSVGGGSGSGVHTRGRLVNYAQAKFIISSGKTRWVAVNFARAANLSAAARERRARAQQQRERAGPPFPFRTILFLLGVEKIHAKVSVSVCAHGVLAREALLRGRECSFRSARSAHSHSVVCECDFLFVQSGGSSHIAPPPPPT